MKIERDDLSVRARRGELDEASEKQLSLLLTSSQEARLAHRAGLEFDAEDSVLPGDDALARRISERVLTARPRPFAAPRPWLEPALAAGAAAAIALALAGPFSVRRPQAAAPTTATTPAPVIEPRIPEPPSDPTPALPSSPAMPAESAGAPRDVKEPLTTPRAKPAQPSAAARSSAEPAAATESASELFGRANRARREAQSELAVTLYRRLQQQYPASAESLSAEMALGMLELKANHAEAALRHFSAYLTRAPDGALAPEALWSEAQALSRLGRREPAQERLRLLLKRFPESAYAGAARAKLEAAP